MINHRETNTPLQAASSLSAWMRDGFAFWLSFCGAFLCFPLVLSAAHVVHVTPQHYDRSIERPASGRVSDTMVHSIAKPRPKSPEPSAPYLVCAEPRLLRFSRQILPLAPLPDLSNATIAPIDTGAAVKPEAGSTPPPAAPLPAPPPQTDNAASAALPPQPQPLILGDDLRHDYLHEDILPFFRAPYFIIPPAPPLPTSKATYQQK